MADAPPPQITATPIDAEPAAAPARAAEIVSLAEAERRQPPSAAAAITLLARGENAFLGKLEMSAGGAVPAHRDATEEYIHVLEGGGEITIDGQTRAIGPGDTVYMPAGAEVSYQNGDAPMVALQVFAGPAPASKYDAWQVVDVQGTDAP